MRIMYHSRSVAWASAPFQIARNLTAMILEVIPMIGYTSATPDYTMGFNDALIEIFSQGNAEVSAAYLLPRLKPGLNVLDVGCGPGTISASLAEIVAPGELHGVDMEESQVELARSAAKASGTENAFFHVGDALALPFEDGFFDVAHFHNALLYIPDTLGVLAEVRRVLKPGGIIGLREMIVGSSFTYPDYGILGDSWEIFEDLLAADEGHPQMGKEMKGHIQRAGFTDVQFTATMRIYSTPEEIELIYSLISKWFLSDEIMEAAIKYSASSEERFDRIRNGYDKWRVEPGAYFVIAFGEVIGVNP